MSSRPGKILEIPIKKGVTDFPFFASEGKNPLFACRKSLQGKNVER